MEKSLRKRGFAFLSNVVSPAGIRPFFAYGYSVPVYPLLMPVPPLKGLNRFDVLISRGGGRQGKRGERDRSEHARLVLRAIFTRRKIPSPKKERRRRPPFRRRAYPRHDKSASCDGYRRDAARRRAADRHPRAPGSPVFVRRRRPYCVRAVYIILSGRLRGPLRSVFSSMSSVREA